VRIAGPRLDARLTAGEYPFGTPALALRAARLVSRRLRRQLVAGLEHACGTHQGEQALSCTIAVDRAAVDIARPALEQLARALLARERPDVHGVALTRLLLTHPASPLYEPCYPEELHERVREALLAL
jgi:hypothetical protein